MGPQAGVGSRPGQGSWACGCQLGTHRSWVLGPCGQWRVTEYRDLQPRPGDNRRVSRLLRGSVTLLAAFLLLRRTESGHGNLAVPTWAPSWDLVELRGGNTGRASACCGLSVRRVQLLV